MCVGEDEQDVGGKMEGKGGGGWEQTLRIF